MALTRSAQMRNLIEKFLTENPGQTFNLDTLRDYAAANSTEEFSHGVLVGTLGNMLKKGAASGMTKLGYNHYLALPEKEETPEPDKAPEPFQPASGIVVEIIRIADDSINEVRTTLSNLDILRINEQDLADIQKIKTFIADIEAAKIKLNA